MATTTVGLYPGSPKADVLGQLLNRCEAGAGRFEVVATSKLRLWLNRGTTTDPNWERWRTFMSRTVTELIDAGLIEVTDTNVVTVTAAGRDAYTEVR